MKKQMTSSEFVKYIQNKHAVDKPKRKNRHRESDLQKACVKWFRVKYPKWRKLLFAIPNGAVFAGTDWQRKVQGKRLKDEGAVPGAADLFLAIPSGEYPGLFIEMKIPTSKSNQSPEQEEFEKSVVGMGYGYAIPRTSLQFENIVTSYLEKGEF